MIYTFITYGETFYYRYMTSCGEDKQNEPLREKINVLVSDLVRHIPRSTSTENGKRLEISDLESRGNVLSMQRKQRR